MKTKQLLLSIVVMFLGFSSFSQNPFTEVINTAQFQTLIDQDIPTRDQVIADDLIVIGSACVGNDCVNNENFGFDALRLKENNLRINFDDTSNAASFPNNDWRITINDSNNGGANYFGIDDATAGNRPFIIEAGAGANALVVESNGGNIGMGTADPVVELHIADIDTPTIRLEQSGGPFGNQTWDVAANETNFFVRDASNGSSLPFKIIPGSSSNALVIRGQSIGVGGGSNAVDPSASIDLRSNSRGLLLNRLTTAERNGLANVEGMVVYDTDFNSLYANDGAVWTPVGADTDDQTADVFQLNGTDLELSLEDDGVATQIVDLSSLDDSGTDDQNITGSGLAANILTIGIEGGTSETVDLSSLDDSGTDDQNITGSGLAANILTIGIEGGTSETVDLSSLDDAGTDDQNISGSGLAANILTIGIEGGSSETVDLSSLDDAGTDDQNISGSGLAGDILTIGIEGGASETVDLSSLNNMGTDDQVLNNFLLSGPILGLTIENGNAVNVSLDPLLEDLEMENAAQQTQIDNLLSANAAQQAMLDDLLARLIVLEDCACMTLGIDDNDGEPDVARLLQNVPNPFDGVTTVGYYIPLHHGKATISITAASGQRIQDIPISRFGEGSIQIDESRLQAAIYFYTLYVDGKRIDTKRMVVK